MKKEERMLLFTSLLILIGIWISYVHQMSPSPILNILKEDYKIYNNDALLNLSVSIIFPTIIVASLLGGVLEQSFGTRNLFILTMLFIAVGLLINYIAINYIIFLLGRVVFGLGFGLGIPFIGSAIMKWYTPDKREILNTVNGLFPFLGNTVSFSLLIPLYTLFGRSWKQALGVWGILSVIIIILWLLSTKNEEIKSTAPKQYEKRLYQNLWKRKEIKLLSAAFASDFFCYSYISVILPTYFMELGNISESLSGLLAAIAFPVVGIIGAVSGGIIMARSGLRKPNMLTGQILKTVGIMIAVLGASTSFPIAIIGICIFGFSNSQWTPGLYMVPMELDEMTPSRVGGAFALILSIGFAAGFISPVLGGWITTNLMTVSGIENPVLNHIFGLKWSLFICGLINLIGVVCISLIKETGPGKESRKMKVLLPN